MERYCCFWCPRPSRPGEVHERSDPCPTCARPYDTPLVKLPAEIGRYRIVSALGRGFYSAAYRAEHATLGTPVVLKLVSVGLYQHFGKNWEDECRTHARLQQGTPFIAPISDTGRAMVAFGPDELECHYAVLDHVPGPSLSEVLADPASHHLSARRAAQIALDLLDILHTFEQQEVFHNDLHANNIIIRPLTPATERGDGLDPLVRAVAIDLGSVLDRSQSGEQRFGDQRWIARHFAMLAESVRRNMGTDVDDDFRMVEALQALAEHLAPVATAQRVMSVSDARRILADTLVGVDQPWRLPFALIRFDDAYNAQALQPWHVPYLWWDPSGRWLRRTTGAGPQVITGMRGCGKTILLRSLHFHARATVSRLASPEQPLETLLRDNWVGVYASCQQLLNPHESGATAAHLPFERLYLAYVKDAIHVLEHARSLDPALVAQPIVDFVTEAMQPIETSEPLAKSASAALAYRQLTELQFRLGAGATACRLRVAPTQAFAHLADELQRASSLFADRTVFFLLDDVSTRYLDEAMVSEVISALLFQHASCAFRITTEAQTLHRILDSPGGCAPADPNRDYEEFDLGGEVYRLLQDTKGRGGVRFISAVLSRRGSHTQGVSELYRRSPEEVLGDVPLESIAKVLGQVSDSAPERKRAYHGVSALEAVCVGDIGDVVKLYERILQRAGRGPLPVDPQVQSEAFLQHSSSLAHYLNRRDQDLKNVALSFARASGELLKRSARLGKGRLRQYTKLYVRVEPGPHAAQVAARLWDLLDAGVFVYDGGAPRTKTRDADPVLQFKLSYRKLLGLASYIGLADRDRFELTGDSLRTFLLDPEAAERVLLESQIRGGDQEPDSVEGEGADALDSSSSQGPALPNGGMSPSRAPTPVGRSSTTSTRRATGSSDQLDFLVPSRDETRVAPERLRSEVSEGPRLRVAARDLELSELPGTNRGRTLVIACGFEDRTAESVRRLLARGRPEAVILAEYVGVPQGDAIRAELRRTDSPLTVVTTADDMRLAVQKSPWPCIIDSTGLAKPFLFHSITAELQQRGCAIVVHTLAQSYYPRNQDLEDAGVTPTVEITSETLSQVAAGVLSGEHGPYKVQRVYSEATAPERSRVLIASASPKNDRLLHLLDTFSFEATAILVPPPTTARRRIARASAELAAAASDVTTTLVEVATNDVVGALREVERLYRRAYFAQGAGVEFGLTGSKAHAIAFAAVAAAAHVSAAWYVYPASFDIRRYTEGYAQTLATELTLLPADIENAAQPL